LERQSWRIRDDRRAALSADVTVRSPLAANDPRAMLPIEEVAVLLDVSVALLKRQHLADPARYPAERVGTLWRLPRWWVERKIACSAEATA
jgi:hypothetical protein